MGIDWTEIIPTYMRVCSCYDSLHRTGPGLTFLLGAGASTDGRPGVLGWLGTRQVMGNVMYQVPDTSNNSEYSTATLELRENRRLYHAAMPGVKSKEKHHHS